MNISIKTIEQMEKLNEDQLAVILKLINYYSLSPSSIFDNICEEEMNRPVSDEKIEKAISEVRRERYERFNRY